jgi:uncharacterized SAM-binding protein YcdF (DUF218 family)
MRAAEPMMARPGDRQRSTRLRRVGWRVLALAVGLAALGSAAPLALAALGSFLVVDDPLQRASAIVVLAGGTPAREAEAAAVYRSGWAPRVVLVGTSELVERRAALEARGVPESAIVAVAEHAADTLAELRLAAEVVRAAPGPVILVTSSFHTRRVQAAWAQVRGGGPVAIVHPVADDSYDPAGWWRDGSMARAVAHEYLGLIELAL